MAKRNRNNLIHYCPWCDNRLPDTYNGDVECDTPGCGFEGYVSNGILSWESISSSDADDIWYSSGMDEDYDFR